MTLILASGSETRAKMLRDAGVAFEVIASTVDENAIKAEFASERRSARKLADALAEAKAREVSEQNQGLVLGADQVLAFRDTVFDKPRDRAEARAQMQGLRGETHELISAAVLIENGKVIWRGVGTADMTMRDFSDAFLDEYLAAEGDAVLWSVGGYQIEGHGAQLFERVEGDYFSILGLPLVEVLHALRDKGVIRT